MDQSLDQQQFFMRKAILLGEKGRLTAPPNPWVGCLIVKGGKIIGEGYHLEPGRPHAETLALKQAGAEAQGATAYITLEPCAHFGRTPPCAAALSEAGIHTVVIPFIDPDPQVSGKGVAFLKEKGIQVIVGVCAQEAALSLKPYLHHRKTGEPYCILKAALSLDGRTSAEDSSSQWITQEEARKDVHLLRASAQAILVGSQTALKDHPTLTARLDLDRPYRQPLRVLIDSQGVVPTQMALFDTLQAPTLVVTTPIGEAKKRQEWEEKGAEILVLPAQEEGFIPLKQLVQILGKRGILQLLVEGGSQLETAFFQEDLVHQLILYYGACLLGNSGRPFLNFSVPSIDLAPRLILEGVSRFGNDVRLDYILSGRN